MDLNALTNPRRSIQEFRTVAGTKDKVGKGKRIIIVDCITENGPVPGALWIFTTDSKSQKGVKQDIPLEETAVTMEKAKEVANTVAAELASRLKAWFPLSQLRPRQRPFSSQNKAISVKDDCSTL